MNLKENGAALPFQAVHTLTRGVETRNSQADRSLGVLMSDFMFKSAVTVIDARTRVCFVIEAATFPYRVRTRVHKNCHKMSNQCFATRMKKSF